uniref:Uncharacterized protein n=1 Tax=Chenopodium quinoa TaxID=63459 RepID=A0A803NB07_CHEQI
MPPIALRLDGGREHGDTRSNRGGSRGRGRGALTAFLPMGIGKSNMAMTLGFPIPCQMFHDELFSVTSASLLFLSLAIQSIESESLLKPILSAEEVPVCVHSTYKRLLQSILARSLSCGLPSDGEVKSDCLELFGKVEGVLAVIVKILTMFLVLYRLLGEAPFPYL